MMKARTARLRIRDNGKDATVALDRPDEGGDAGHDGDRHSIKIVKIECPVETQPSIMSVEGETSLDPVAIRIGPTIEKFQC